jgi:hypothetical protein
MESCHADYCHVFQPRYSQTSSSKATEAVGHSLQELVRLGGCQQSFDLNVQRSSTSTYI